jgi:hypothetical protein
MPQLAVEFHPLAADEVQAAERWYRERNETASGRFQRELDRAIDRDLRTARNRVSVSQEYKTRTTSPLSVLHRVSRTRRRPGDRCRRAWTTPAGILASALNGGSGGQKSQVHDRTPKVIRCRTATGSRQTPQRALPPVDTSTLSRGGSRSNGAEERQVDRGRG